MLTKEQIVTINKLSLKYAPLKEGFPKWNPETVDSVFFPDTNDLRAIAEKVEPFSFQLHANQTAVSPKYVCKYMFVRFLQPLLRMLFKRQMFFNEYMWLLANTVAQQNQKIMSLEAIIYEIQKKHSN